VVGGNRRAAVYIIRDHVFQFEPSGSEIEASEGLGKTVALCVKRVPRRRMVSIDKKMQGKPRKEVTSDLGEIDRMYVN